MRAFRVAIASIVALLLLLPASAGAKTETPDVKTLIPRAMDLVTAHFPGAVFLEAEGLPADGQVAWSEEDIVQWQFAFGTPQSAPTLSAVVRYGPPPQTFSPVVGLPLPFTGALPMDKPPHMTLKSAVKLLRKAGFSCPFEGVVLTHPLVIETVNPRYLFQCIGPFGGIHTIAVDTVTKDVFVVNTES